MDPLAEPIRCPHGGEFIVLSDGSTVTVTPCRACESQTVAPAQERRTLLSA